MVVGEYREKCPGDGPLVGGKNGMGKDVEEFEEENREK